MKRHILTLAAAAITAASGAASAAVIDFTALTTAGQGFVSVQGNPFSTYTEDGYKLQTGTIGFGSARTGDVAPGFLYNGHPMTWYYGSASLFNDDLSGNSPTTLSQVHGNPFDLHSIDLTALNNYYTFTITGQEGALAGLNVQFVGNVHGGGTVTDTVHISDEFNFQTFDFSNFNNLDSVVFDISFPVGVQGSAGFQFDNIVVTNSDSGPTVPPTNPVPEPASLALLGAGFAALAARKKSAK
jgi:hypothetical protein